MTFRNKRRAGSGLTAFVLFGIVFSALALFPADARAQQCDWAFAAASTAKKVSWIARAGPKKILLKKGMRTQQLNRRGPDGRVRKAIAVKRPTQKSVSGSFICSCKSSSGSPCNQPAAGTDGCYAWTDFRGIFCSGTCSGSCEMTVVILNPS